MGEKAKSIYCINACIIMKKEYEMLRDKLVHERGAEARAYMDQITKLQDQIRRFGEVKTNIVSSNDEAFMEI